MSKDIVFSNPYPLFSLDETDREVLRLMKGLRVSFTEREDAYILLADIVRNIMNLSAKGNPLCVHD